MVYKEYQPHPKLSTYIECYWSAYAERPPFREQESLIPDGTIELMFNFGENYFQIVNGEKKVINGSHVIGIRREALRISQSSKQDFFCIRFRPGGTYPFFGIPAHLYANDFYTLEELIGPEYKTIEEKLFNIRDNNKRVIIIEEYLFKKFNTRLEDDHFVRHCIDLLDHPGRLKIGGLAERFNSNYKTIERKFNKVVGLTPFHFLKIRRFNRALVTIYSLQQTTLTDAALNSGYYDQSHFNREFRQLTGMNPGDFLREQFKIVEVIQPALAGRLSNSYKL
jgi:AraC-like DNA-binding protein